MSLHKLDLTGVRPRAAAPFAITRPGWDTSPDGRKIGFTDYYMTINERPRYEIAGEFHYSRLDSTLWDGQLAKMKEAGVTIVSTYVFWNHHEEKKGIWDFTGRRNLRRFVRLCQKHGLMVIVRLGPFDHGEVRNGGVPDWVFAEPCEARSTDPVFMGLVCDLYTHIAEQLKGLYWKDGGPIIAAQLDNEYMHSSAPWEFLTGITEDWVPGGNEGMKYIGALREAAENAGIAVPFYTNTGWGEAPVPQDVLPLWGGYAYRPWIFYQHTGEHPLTDEYLYRNYHDDDVPRNSEFDPNYLPSSKPYACCEMGGGMVVTYNYRFILPLRSVDAMANIKMASGCNFLGYYMFSGGSNPIGGDTDGIPGYLNESQTPKVSYDYQAPVGEFGQVRRSARRLRLLHLFATTFSDRLTPLLPRIPDDQQGITEHDLSSLRWAVRSDGTHGFVFLNDFQDHATMEDQKDETLEITLADGSVTRFDGVGLSSGENAILPFNMDLDGVMLRAATVQPVTRISRGDGAHAYVFLKPVGMSRLWMRFDGQEKVLDPDTPMDEFNVAVGGASVHIICLSRAMAERMSIQGDDILFTDGDNRKSSVATATRLTVCDDSPVLYHGDSGLMVSGVAGEVTIDRIGASTDSRTVMLGKGTGLSAGQTSREVDVRRLHDDRYVLTIPDGLFDLPDVSEVLLRLRYVGDIGWVFAGSRLLDDNFANGDIWEIGLSQYRKRIQDNGGAVVLVITPLKKGAKVTIDAAMAARMGSSEGEKASLLSAELVPVFAKEIAL